MPVFLGTKHHGADGLERQTPPWQHFLARIPVRLACSCSQDITQPSDIQARERGQQDFGTHCCRQAHVLSIFPYFLLCITLSPTTQVLSVPINTSLRKDRKGFVGI